MVKIVFKESALLRNGKFQLESGERLTKSEVKVAEEVASGKTNKEIARALCVSAHTVRVHLMSIFRKAEVKSRTRLVAQIFNSLMVDESKLESAGKADAPGGTTYEP